MPTTIDPQFGVATLINVFTVTSEHQRELVRLLDEATEQVMRHQPGFVSANVHASLDGTRVVNYVQWESAAHFEAMLEDPPRGSTWPLRQNLSSPSNRSCSPSSPRTT